MRSTFGPSMGRGCYKLRFELIDKIKWKAAKRPRVKIANHLRI